MLKQAYKNTDLIALAFKVSSLWTSLLFIHHIINALTPALLVWATSYFVDTALSVTELNQMISPMLALSSIILFQWLQGDIRKIFNSKIQIATRNTYQLNILEKKAKLAYHHIENPATADLINLVSEDSEKKIITMFNDTMGLLTTIINAASISLIFVFEYLVGSISNLGYILSFV